MSGCMKVEIIKRETIKPSSPTPPHLRNLKLSIFDQFSPLSYTPILLFYPLNDDDDTKVKSTQISEHLKQSLSKILIHFYPLAGRIQPNNVSIDCNDDGVDYLEARVLNYRLSDFLKKPEAKLLNTLLPVDIESTEAAHIGHVLLVQANFFKCGGMCLAISISHKIADAATFTAFLKAWATTTIDCSFNNAVVPEFNAASLFPPLDFSNMPQPDYNQPKSDIVITRRYMFDASKINLLKSKLVTMMSSSSVIAVHQPTRVEAVLALIWKCASRASRSNSGVVRPSAMFQAVNLRKKIINGPPRLDNLLGNLAGFFVVEMDQKREIELDGLVGQLRKGIENFHDNYVDKILGEEGLLMTCEKYKEIGYLITREDIDLYICSSWCRFPLYDVDFGWGRPIWVSRGSSGFKNLIILMDARDGQGIEAWVNLSEQDMALLEHDQEMLTFASLNPSISLN